MKISYSSRNVAWNSLRSVVYKLLSMILSFVSAPLLLGCLGEEKYGVWQTLLSAISWIYYLDLGIGSGLRIRLSESLANEKVEDAKKYVSVSFVILSILCFCFLLLVIGLLLFFDFEAVFHIDISTNENINKILLVSFLFVGINFVFSLINNIFYAVQNASMVGALGLFGQILYVFGLFIYYKTGNGLILVVSAIEGATQIAKNLLGLGITFYKYPECAPSFRMIDFSYAKGIVSFGILAFLGNVLSLILNSTDNIIIMRCFGAAEVTPYSLCFRYFGMISSLFAIIVIPLQSAYTMAYTKNDYIWIKKNLQRAVLIFLLFLTGTVCAALLIRPITKIWLRKELSFTEGTVFGTAIYTTLLMISHIQSTFLMGIGRIKETTIASALGAVINIPLSVFLACTLQMKVDGVILGSVLALSVGIIVGFYVLSDSLKRVRTYRKHWTL